MNLQQKYDRDDFLKFLKSFLPNFEKDIRPAAVNSLQVTREVFSLGQSADLDLQVLELTHLSSADARVALAMDGFRMMKDSATYRALVVYRSEEEDDWRLSLMTATPNVNEKGKVRQTFSNPRRFSFFLGPNAKINTPYQLLIKQDSVKDFPDLQKRFSLEVVNKEFYTQIAILFTQLAGGKREIGKKSIDAGGGDLKLPSTNDEVLHKEFTVRLIGRLVFCWFLKKKISDKGLALLSEDLLSTKAVIANKSYYHTILEPLFFEVLNTPVEKREKKYKSSPWSNTPFLNGGLFNPHHHDYYELGTMGFSKHINTLKIPDSWFKEIFEIFETYNFTIDENTSVDIELSIEPEMLGRIFENLLAEINPETGETARKATGSYYTPRAIVEYMVDESLKQYLLAKTDLADEKISMLLTYDDQDAGLSGKEKEAVIDALATIKIIDPACGSGAFPMGILQKMLLVLQKVDPDSQSWLDIKLASIPDAALRRDLKTKLKADNFNYIHKLGIIRDAIYGVDIQPIAVEISKLRFFLSLIVDEKINDSKENRGIEPLPNLEFKFVCANSLIPLPKALVKIKHKEGEAKEASQRTMFDAVGEIDDLKKLRDEYLRSFGEEKKKIERKFQETQSKMFKHSLSWGTQDSQTLKLSQWNPFSEEPCTWFDPDWMFGVKDGFDIVIANPPYVRQEDIKEFKPQFKDNYECFSGTADIYVYFYERGFKILKPNGVLTYISSNKYFRAGYGKQLREFLGKKACIHKLIDFGDSPVFTAIAYPSIIVLSRNAPQKNSTIVFSWNPSDLLSEFESRLSAESFCMPQTELGSDGWRLESSTVLRLLKKLHTTGKPLSEYVDDKLCYGIKTGLNEAFVVNREQRDRLIEEHPLSAKLLKPFLRGRDIKRWRIGFADQYLIKIESSENKEHPWSEKSESEAEKIFAKTYPAIYGHFQSLKKIKLEKPDDRGCRNMLEKLHRRDDQGKYYWELRSCKYWGEFDKTMIAWGNLATAPQFTIVEGGYFISAPATFFVSNSEFLLGILNSKVTKYLVSQSAAERQGGFLEFKPMYIAPLAIPTASPAQQARIAKLTNSILTLKKRKPESDTTIVEGEIDQMVYELYDLTKDEIKIVEGGSDSDSDQGTKVSAKSRLEKTRSS